MNFEWKKVFLYAIAPALIAGLFAIAPKLYDIATEPKAELTYIAASGPELQVANGVQKIVSITVQNSGSRSLSNIVAQFVLDDGKIETHKVQESSGLKPILSVSERELGLTLQKLHPGEKFTLSALVLGSKPGASPYLTLRSDEVLGGALEEPKSKKGERLPFYSALSTALSVFAMAMVFLTKSKSIGGFLANHKQDAIFYIPARLGMPNIAKAMHDARSNLTYLRMADILMSYGLSTNENNKNKAIAALKCLVMISDMAETSKRVVVSNLRILMGVHFDQTEIDELEKKGVHVEKLLKFRELVDQIAENSC